MIQGSTEGDAWQRLPRSGTALDAAESALLNEFRCLAPHQRESVINLARALAQANARIRNSRSDARRAD